MNASTVLIAIRMTEVGVAVFSETRNNSVKMANEQISIPLAAKPENKPPINPPRTSTSAYSDGAREREKKRE